MIDSNAPEDLEAKYERNRQQRLRSVKRWVEFITTHDAEEWGDQQNRLIDSQLASARETEIDIDHRRRVARAGREDSRIE